MICLPTDTPFHQGHNSATIQGGSLFGCQWMGPRSTAADWLCLPSPFLLAAGRWYRGPLLPDQICLPLLFPACCQGCRRDQLLLVSLEKQPFPLFPLHEILLPFGEVAKLASERPCSREGVSAPSLPHWGLLVPSASCNSHCSLSTSTWANEPRATWGRNYSKGKIAG